MEDESHVPNTIVCIVLQCTDMVNWYKKKKVERMGNGNERVRNVDYGNFVN